jgi:hypothetical protein
MLTVSAGQTAALHRDLRLVNIAEVDKIATLRGEIADRAL